MSQITGSLSKEDQILIGIWSTLNQTDLNPYSNPFEEQSSGFKVDRLTSM